MYDPQQPTPAQDLLHPTAEQLSDAFTAPAVWVGEAPAASPAASGREADPYEVIEFLLAKAEEQQITIAEQTAFAGLQAAEVARLKAQIESDQDELRASRLEIAAQLADYEVLMQNILAAERELDYYKQRASERPKIQLPFHAEQKLAQLGFGEDLTAREAV